MTGADGAREVAPTAYVLARASLPGNLAGVPTARP